VDKKQAAYPRLWEIASASLPHSDAGRPRCVDNIDALEKWNRVRQVIPQRFL